MSDHVDMYTSVHKGQRSRFFDISSQAGRVDYADQKSLDGLYDELDSFREHMRLHAALEERFIHPLLSSRVPGGARKLEEDHRFIHQRFDDLVSTFGWIRARSADFEKRQELALEFYRTWNRFTSFYFMHINKEEEQVQPLLWELCTNEELAATFKTILASQKPTELMGNLKMMLPAMNLYERVDLLRKGQASMSPEAFQGALRLAEQVLTSNDFAALKSKMGL